MIEVLEYTHCPIHFMGKCAGQCWGANVNSYSKNYKRGLECLKIPHGRVLEYADVTIKISGYSARALRELRTHSIGTTTLQSSTRYIDYKDMTYFTPPSIESNESANMLYTQMMNDIAQTYNLMVNMFKIPKEDIANMLPLGMHSTIVLKLNVRALIHLAEMRLCTRAYHEIRSLVLEIKKVLSGIDEEWKEITTYMEPKCCNAGYCTETYCCGLKPKKEEFVLFDIQDKPIQLIREIDIVEEEKGEL